MDSFELNKVAGAVLGTLLLAMGSGFLAELLYHPKPAGNAGYALPEPAPKSAGTAVAAPTVEPIAVRLASADAEKGKGGTKACQACHSFEKGGPNKVGPDLYDVVERPKGSHEGFAYSAALKDKGGAWDYADLDHFLESPKGFVAGTKMAFAGISSPQERANVIAYLRSLSDSPKPLPAAEKTEEPAKDAAAKDAPGKDAAAEAKPADKPAGPKPGETKPAEAKPATDTARPVPAPEVQPQRNEVAPSQPPVATPSGDIETSQPAATETPAATEPPAKADPEAKPADLAK